MNIIINSLELASNLAEQEVINELVKYGFCSSEADLYETDNSGDSKYTEEAQDCFNRWYDYFSQAILLTKI